MDTKTIEQTYQKKSQLEHILLRPDSYIGSTEPCEQAMWVIDPDTASPVYKEITFVPGLLKIFDEVLVNASDNKQRDKSMNKLEVTICPESNTLTVWNNGASVPVVVHETHGIHVAEMLFGHLLTGSNFDDTERKVTGGRNGYGAKLANIFSTRFVVETNDGTRGLKFRQVYTANMTCREDPVVTKATSKRDYTCISFQPDLARFKMTSLDADTVALLKKRVYDMAGVSDKSLKVILNGTPVPVASFKDYAACFQKALTAEGSTTTYVYERLNDRWEIAVGVSDGQFRQVSYVNSICTTKGGSHVAAVVDKISEFVADKVNRKGKSDKSADVKPFQVKNHLAVYVNCLVENPAFDSQTKDTLTTRAKDFGSLPVISDGLMKRISKIGIVERVTTWARFKEGADLTKASAGKKKMNLRGIPKLDDANLAGGPKSAQCTLILTEGDSAKALAIAGLAVVGRDTYGVFPLKGKPLNVRDCALAKMMANTEIKSIVDIVGLKFATTYTPENLHTLRYGSIMIMADQDHDGSHIKGLLINFFHAYWPSLLRLPGFLCEFITPIVKCSKGKVVVPFYTLPEYTAWQDANDKGKGWTVKYYKGLGTSSSSESKEYFSALGKHRIAFSYEGTQSDDAILLAFERSRADARKAWLLAVEEGTFVDYNVSTMPYSVFVNKELSLYSVADNVRSIPSAIDGLKPSQRKILFGCFKRRLTQEVKVAQLTGYIGEHAMYHHGEQSLATTIIGMAQDFTGSNNMNLLFGSGQFGTRLDGGKDAASPRYIFTTLMPMARTMFHAHDDPLLQGLTEDGVDIEPKYYMPVLPMVLVNGASGIGTGWSTDVPCYNPLDLLAAIRRKLAVHGDDAASSEPQAALTPWYRGFKGTIVEKSPKHYVSRGVARLDVATATVIISELPVGTWTHAYKLFLDSMTEEQKARKVADKAKIKSEKMEGKKPKTKKVTVKAEDGKVSRKPKLHVKEETVCVEEGEPLLIPTVEVADAVEVAAGSGLGSTQVTVVSVMDNSGDTEVLLHVKVSPSSVAALQDEALLYKAFHLETPFTTTNMHLFDENTKIRKFDSAEEILDMFFDLRMEYYIRRHALLLETLKKQWMVLDNKARFLLLVTTGEVIITQPMADLLQQLKDLEFAVFNDEHGYDYLLSIPIHALTKERVEKLTADRDAKGVEVKHLESQTPRDLWVTDLDNVETCYTAKSSVEEKESTVPAVAVKAPKAAKLRPSKRLKTK